MDDAEERAQKSQKAIVSAVCWVNRGHARATLEEYNPTEEELNRGRATAKKLLKGEDPSQMDIGEAKMKIEKNLKGDQDMEDSSDDDETTAPIFTSELGALKEKEKNLKKGKKGKASNPEDMEEDEGMVVDNDQYPDEFSDSEEEKDDYTIRKSDSLIVAATADEDFSNLEVYLYDHRN